MKKKLVSMIAIITILINFPLVVNAVGNYGVNFSSAAYTSANPFAQAGYTGECTWYCCGRAYEKYGISLPCRGNANTWQNTSGYPTDQTPSANSIAVWTSGSRGHVAFVENYSNGIIYLSESNVSYNDVPIHVYSEGNINLSTGYYTNTFTDYSWGLGNWSGRGNPNYYIHLSGTSPQSQGAYIGDDFYAYIITDTNWIHLTANNNNVELSMQNSDVDPKQIWHFIRQNNYNQYKIINEYNGYVLDAAGGGTLDHSNIQTYPNNDTLAQRWVMSFVTTSGIVAMHPASAPNMAMDVPGGGFTGGNNIQVYTANGSQAQAFHVYNLATNGYNYAVPKPAAPVITSAYSYRNMLNLKWTDSPQVNIFDNDRRYEVYIYDSNKTLINSANVGNKTEYSYFVPKQGNYYARIVATACAYNTSYVAAYQSSEMVPVTAIDEACASLTNENNGNVYLLFDAHRDYNGAKKYCESLGGHLATITSSEEEEVVRALCEKGNNLYYWLGGTDEEVEGIWKWITSEIWSYTNWNEGEPSNSSGSENYLHYIKAANSWNDVGASYQTGFICEIENQSVSSSLKKEIKYNGHKYILFDQSLPWTEAKKYCEAVGGHLVTINSAEENSTISSLISNGSKSRYWLGATSENDNKWLWVTDETLDYTNWNQGEPNDSDGIEKYAHIYVSEENDGLWNDASNYSYLNMYGFICEIDKITPTTKTTVTKKSASSSIDIDVENAELGTNVIVAMYDKGRLTDLQINVYDGDDISLTTFADYNEIKVMLWENLSTLKPLGNAEIIKN